MNVCKHMQCRGCGLSGLALPNLFISASYRLLGQLPKPYLQHIHPRTHPHSVTHSSHAHDSYTHPCTLSMHPQASTLAAMHSHPLRHTPSSYSAHAPLQRSPSSHAEPLPPRTSWRPHNHASVAQTPLHQPLFSHLHSVTTLHPGIAAITCPSAYLSSLHSMVCAHAC